MLLIWGATLLVGAALGGTDPLKPLASVQSAINGNNTSNTPANFKTIHSLAELEHQLQQAQQQRKRVLVDFYADWCVSCKVMARDVFGQADVQNNLQDWVLLKADVTQNSAEERALQQHFTIFGPPAILFFSQGEEIANSRIVGEISKSAFLSHLQQVKALP